MPRILDNINRTFCTKLFHFALLSRCYHLWNWQRSLCFPLFNHYQNLQQTWTWKFSQYLDCTLNGWKCLGIPPRNWIWGLTKARLVYFLVYILCFVFYYSNNCEGRGAITDLTKIETKILWWNKGCRLPLEKILSKKSFKHCSFVWSLLPRKSDFRLAVLVSLLLQQNRIWIQFDSHRNCLSH